MSKIIIVDDSPFLLDKIAKFLGEEGHQVLAMGHDGHEGFELYQKHRPDLITLDLSMPRMDGEQCLEKILAFDSNAKVLIISSMNDQDIICRALSNGAKSFLCKPLLFQLEDFCGNFRNAIDEALLDDQLEVNS